MTELFTQLVEQHLWIFKSCGVEVDADLKPIFDEHQETTAKRYLCGW